MSTLSYMHPLNGSKPPGILPRDVGPLTAWCRGIESRTGVAGYFNHVTGFVHFCLGDPTIGVHACRVLVNGVLRTPDQDETCRSIMSARRRMSDKERDIRDARRRSEHDSEEAMRRIRDDAAKAAAPVVKHELNKAKMGRHSRPIVSVP